MAKVHRGKKYIFDILKRHMIDKESGSKIANEEGLPHSNISNWKRRYGDEVIKLYGEPEEDKYGEDFIKNVVSEHILGGVGHNELCKTYGVPSSKLATWKKKYTPVIRQETNDAMTKADTLQDKMKHLKNDNEMLRVALNNAQANKPNEFMQKEINELKHTNQKLIRKIKGFEEMISDLTEGNTNLRERLNNVLSGNEPVNNNDEALIEELSKSKAKIKNLMTIVKAMIELNEEVMQ